jgi:hypothetical protein
MTRVDSYCFAVVEGAIAGTRARIGDFYALVWRDAEGAWNRVLDPLAASLPFGAFAPAEIYDVAAMQAARADAEYWRSLAPDAPGGDPGQARPLRQHPADPCPHRHCGHDPLRAHPSDRASGRARAGRARTRAGGPDLPRLRRRAADAGGAHHRLRGRPRLLDRDRDGRGLGHRRPAPPDTTNWGYDVVIAGMAAINPALLETGRPDELVDLAAALHTFPGAPKKLILDVVYGHSDNQGLDVLNSHYFAGPNMYGQNLAYRNPTVRAILLEMQRRKVDFGADGVRVDGAQDFKWWDPDTHQNRHDDEYLQEMADVVQEVCGRRYRPWFIFEDGRPWPREDWELASTYRAVIEAQRDDDVFQWGPLSFAHNTPFLFTFWLQKWWRIREILDHGETWISGFSNHDTLRRGTQVNPNLNINTRLGETRMEILDKAYDNAAAHMLTYACPPRRADGLPERDRAHLLGLHPQPGRPLRREDPRRGGDLAAMAGRRLFLFPPGASGG